MDNEPYKFLIVRERTGAPGVETAKTKEEAIALATQRCIRMPGTAHCVYQLIAMANLPPSAATIITEFG